MKNLIKSITKGEWHFWFKVLIVLIILTSISRVFAFFWAGDDVWTGRIYFSPVDRFVYVSYIEQVKEGAFLLNDLFTDKNETVPMVNIFWIGLGLIARLTGASTFAVIEFSRILLIPFFLFFLYLFFSFFFKDIFKRKLAFLLAVFGGGIGTWAYPLLEPFFRGKFLADHLPIDFIFSESFVFLTSYYSVHFIASTSLFILIFFFTLLFLEKKKYIYGFYAGICGAFLLNFHPFTFVVIAFILFSYQIFLFFKDKVEAWKLFKYLLLFSVFVLPSALYHLYMMSTPWWQNQTWSSNTEVPNLIFIIIGYGFLLFFAMWSFINILRKKLEFKYEGLIVIWFLAQICFIFFPVSVQRRFLEGYQLVLIILSIYAITPLLKKRKWIIDNKIYATCIFILFFSISFLLIIYFDFYNFYSRIKSMYMTQDNYMALKEVKEYTEPDALIITDIYNANMLPGLALRRVFVGHGVETINFEEKYKALKLFLDSKDSLERYDILKYYDIDYFFYDGSYGKQWHFNPDEEYYLKLIYNRGEFSLYKILK